jgi:hypothetical protein
VDPLTSTSRVLDPLVVGQEHYDVARETQRVLQRFRDLQDIIAILGIDELSEEDKATVARARRLQRFASQPFFVAEVFTGRPGAYVSIKDTVASFKEILEGKTDTLPEQAFFLAGTIDDVRKNADRLTGGDGAGGGAAGAAAAGGGAGAGGAATSAQGATPASEATTPSPEATTPKASGAGPTATIEEPAAAAAPTTSTGQAKAPDDTPASADSTTTTPDREQG